MTDDRTMVSEGIPTSGSAGALRGRVLGERYEVRAQLRNDVFTRGLLAFDQETEDRVVLRIVRGELLDEKGRASTYRALRSSVGVGGRFLPGLLDADKDGEDVFAVEPVPEGASLRDVLDRRIAARNPMKDSELLPLVTHLETALAAVPPPLRHGDVRAEHVWVDPHRLWLLGAFMVPALPDAVVRRLLHKDSGLRRRMAPEVLRGIASDAADRYGVGAIVYEAMTLKKPPEHGESSSDLPPTPVGEQVRSLLHADPGMRARSLEPLIDALAKASGVAVPELDPGTFRAARRMSPPRAGSVVPPLAKGVGTGAKGSNRPPGKASDRPAAKGAKGAKVPVSKAAALAASLIPRPARSAKARASEAPDEALSGDTVQTAAMSDEDVLAALGPSKTDVDGRVRRDDDDGLPPPPSISEEDRTKQLPISALTKEGATAKLTPMSKKRARAELEQRVETGGLDPRLVRAALARQEPAGHVDDEGEAADTIAPPPSESDHAVPLDPSVPVQAAPGGTQELRLDELVDADEDEDTAGFSRDPAVPVGAAPGGTQELALDELEDAEEEYDEDYADDYEDGVPLDPATPATARPGGTQELRLEDLEVQVQDDEQHAVRAPRAPARDVGLADLEEMRRRREAVPEALIQPIPRPRKDSMVGMKGPVLFDDTAQRAAVAPVVQAPEVAPAPARPEPAVVVRPPSEPPQPRRAPRLTEPMAKPAAPAAPTDRNWGALIIVVAVLLGAAIILGSFLYARYQKSRADELRRQQIQERIERMRDGD